MISSVEITRWKWIFFPKKWEDANEFSFGKSF